MRVIDSGFVRNVGSTGGGGICLENIDGVHATIRNASLTANQAGAGGGGGAHAALQ